MRRLCRLNKYHQWRKKEVGRGADGMLHLLYIHILHHITFFYLSLISVIYRFPQASNFCQKFLHGNLTDQHATQHKYSNRFKSTPQYNLLVFEGELQTIYLNELTLCSTMMMRQKHQSTVQVMLLSCKTTHLPFTSQTKEYRHYTHSRRTQPNYTEKATIYHLHLDFLLNKNT